MLLNIAPRTSLCVFAYHMFVCLILNWGFVHKQTLGKENTAVFGVPTDPNIFSDCLNLFTCQVRGQYLYFLQIKLKKRTLDISARDQKTHSCYMLGVAACLSWLFVNNQYTIRLRDHGQEAYRILSGHLVIPQVYLCFIFESWQVTRHYVGIVSIRKMKD